MFVRLLSLGMLIGVLGCLSKPDSGSPTGDKKVDPPGGTTSPVTTPTAQREPDFKVTAEQFSKEFKDSASEAGKKYGEKMIELTGSLFFGRFGQNPLQLLLVGYSGPKDVVPIFVRARSLPLQR